MLRFYVDNQRLGVFMKLDETYMGKLGVHLKKIQEGEYQSGLRQKKNRIDALLEDVDNINGKTLDEIMELGQEVEALLGEHEPVQKPMRKAYKRRKKTGRPVFDAIENYRKNYPKMKTATIYQIAEFAGLASGPVAKHAPKHPGCGYNSHTRTIYFRK